MKNKKIKFDYYQIANILVGVFASTLTVYIIELDISRYFVLSLSGISITFILFAFYFLKKIISKSQLIDILINARINSEVVEQLKSKKDIDNYTRSQIIQKAHENEYNKDDGKELRKWFKYSILLFLISLVFFNYNNHLKSKSNQEMTINDTIRVEKLDTLSEHSLNKSNKNNNLKAKSNFEIENQ